MVDKNTQVKHWAGKDLKIVQSYWDSPPAIKRSKWFAEQLKNYEFDSIFEVGMFAGRNLRYIGEAFPNVQLHGIDVNPKAVKFAQQKLPKAEIFQTDLHLINTCSVHADILFTSGVLIHVPPEELFFCCGNFMPHANKYIMHLEQLGNNEVTAGPKHLKPTYKVSDQVQWAPDLLSVYKDLGQETEVIPLPDDCKTNGASELIVVKL